jgi:hypothetical protein
MTPGCTLDDATRPAYPLSPSSRLRRRRRRVRGVAWRGKVEGALGEFDRRRGAKGHAREAVALAYRWSSAANKTLSSLLFE